MKQVASLRYGVIFKKAFSQPDIFKAFVKDFIGDEIHRTIFRRLNRITLLKVSTANFSRSNAPALEYLRDASASHLRFLHLKLIIDN